MDSRYFFMDVILSSLRGWFQPFFEGMGGNCGNMGAGCPCRGEHGSPVGVSLLRHFVPPPLKRRLSQIVSSLEEMPDRAEESARANMIRPLVCHSSGTSCHLLYKRRLSQIVSSLEEMPGRAEESARANMIRPYGGTGILHILYGFRFVIPCRDRCPHLSAVTSHPFHTRRDKRRTLCFTSTPAQTTL